MINKLHVTAFTLVLGLASLAQAQTFTSIFSFDGSDGVWPYTGRLAIDRTTGTLYGTAAHGGSSFDPNGVAFSVTTAGTETVLHIFSNGSDGGWPYAGLIRDGEGNLFGTTSYGGSSAGVVFKIDAGNETVLHSFSGGTSDGCAPFQSLVRDKKGNLFGTTLQCGSSNEGTIFKIHTAGNETILHSFTGGSSDGAYPTSGPCSLTGKATCMA